MVIVLASVAVFLFARTGVDAEARRACTPLCALRPDYAGQDRRAPDFDLPAVGGGRLRLSDHRGRVVVLNFWTKTCRPCLEELPSLATLAAATRGRADVVVLTVSTDESAEDAAATLRSVLGAEPAFATGIDPEGAIVTGKYGTKLYPETWIVDARGVIRARFDGPRDWSSAVVVDLVESVTHPLACQLSADRGQTTGPHAAICAELFPG